MEEACVEVLEAIKSRRSIRKFRPEPVPQELLNKILEVGRLAPSAKNQQPWNFIILKDHKHRKRIAENTAENGDFLAEAAVGIAVVVDPAISAHCVEDGSITSNLMILTAHSLGLGTCWIGAYGSEYEENVKELMKIPNEKRLLSIIALGYPNEVPPQKTRKTLGELLFIDHYGRK
jgi:nitroreductase